MKTYRTQNSERASALLVVMLITGILTFLVSSYLILTVSQNKLVTRSLCWNTAMPIAEAGIEEALAHVHKNPTNFANDGWSKSGTNYSMQHWIGSNNYSVTIGTQGMMMTITSTGNAWRQDTNYLSRTVQLSAEIWNFQQVGLVARIVTFGGDFTADSYDSSDSNFSTGGQYDPHKNSDKALVGTAGAAFSMGGNSSVKGYVADGVGQTPVAPTGSASVGDLSYHQKGAQTMPLLHSTNGYTITAPDVQVPYTDGIAPAPGTNNGTYYNYVLSGGRYMAGNVDSVGNATTMVVTKPSVLYVTTNLQLHSITFLPGAHLNLYVAMQTLTFSPVLIGGTAAQFTVLGLPSCKGMTTTSDFTGVIYAPEMDLVAAGNSAIYGAVLAASFTCHGTFDFHFDFATSKSWITDPVTILSWAEL
jgi:uncharacterized protein with PQ loop repeat